MAMELIAYPWLPGGNDTELPDPPPPRIDVISYAEYIESTREEIIEEEITEHMVLPGWDYADEGPHRDIFRNEIPPEQALPNIEPPEEAFPEAVVPADNNPMVRYVLLGSVKIPRLNVSENLFMGTESQVNFGVGHLIGTPLPGEAGNSVIAAHRTARNGIQPFRHLDLLSVGDAVIVNVNGEVFTYTVYESFIVHELETWVLHSIADETHVLTMVTCDPVVVVTRRDNRLIVRARL